VEQARARSAADRRRADWNEAVPTSLRACREPWAASRPNHVDPDFAPAAHYWMAASATDSQRATRPCPGLYAVGEVAPESHVPIALASNSLVECLGVFARQLGGIDAWADPDVANHCRVAWAGTHLNLPPEGQGPWPRGSGQRRHRRADRGAAAACWRVPGSNVVAAAARPSADLRLVEAELEHEPLLRAGQLDPAQRLALSPAQRRPPEPLQTCQIA